MDPNPIDRTLIAILRSAPPLGAAADVPGASIDWNELARRAERTNLAALLFKAIQGKRELAPPPDVAGRLRHVYLQRTIANAVISAEAGKIASAFREKGVPLVLLKGVALVHSLYDDAGVRALGDIDVLVRPEDQAAAGALMRGLGYEAAPDLAEGFREEFESEQVYRRTAEPQVSVDLHRHLFNVPYFRQRVSMDWFWQHTERVTIGGVEGRMFDPAAQLLHLAPHSAYHHRSEGARWTYDIALLVARAGDRIAWRDTLRTAKQFGLTCAVEESLRAVEHDWGVALPADAKRALEEFPATRSERVAFAAMTSPQNRARILWDIANMPGWRGKLTYLGRSVVPTKDYMMRRYRIENPRMLPWFYLRRVLDGAGFFFASVGSMSRSAWRALVRAPE